MAKQLSQGRQASQALGLPNFFGILTAVPLQSIHILGHVVPVRKCTA
jgi:hypothetical protein